jgi:hypothetical protein
MTSLLNVVFFSAVNGMGDKDTGGAPDDNGEREPGSPGAASSDGHHMETDLIDFEDENPDETVLDGDSDDNSDDGARQTIDQENPAGGRNDHPTDKVWEDYHSSGEKNTERKKNFAESEENSVSAADLEKNDGKRKKLPPSAPAPGGKTATGCTEGGGVWVTLLSITRSGRLDKGPPTLPPCAVLVTETGMLTGRMRWTWAF